jgi:hypothetical protein
MKIQKFAVFEFKHETDFEEPHKSWRSSDELILLNQRDDEKELELSKQTIRIKQAGWSPSEDWTTEHQLKVFLVRDDNGEFEKIEVYTVHPKKQDIHFTWESGQYTIRKEWERTYFNEENAEIFLKTIGDALDYANIDDWRDKIFNKKVMEFLTSRDSKNSQIEL